MWHFVIINFELGILPFDILKLAFCRRYFEIDVLSFVILKLAFCRSIFWNFHFVVWYFEIGNLSFDFLNLAFCNLKLITVSLSSNQNISTLTSSQRICGKAMDTNFIYLPLILPLITSNLPNWDKWYVCSTTGFIIFYNQMSLHEV